MKKKMSAIFLTWPGFLAKLIMKLIILFGAALCVGISRISTGLVDLSKGELPFDEHRLSAYD